MKTLKVALFPGSFDPVTLAHVDLVKRGLQLFDKVIIGLGVNTNKSGLIPHQDRLVLLREIFGEDTEQLQVISFTGLTIDACKAYGATYLLRGMRNTHDFEYEKGIAANNHVLNPAIETVFLLADGSKAHISSTIVRELLINNAHISTLVPEAVIHYWNKKRSED